MDALDEALAATPAQESAEGGKVRELELRWHSLQAQFEAAEDELGQLENQRYDIAVAGGDVAAHSRKLIEARENVRTLEGAVARAKADYEAAEKRDDRDRVRRQMEAAGRTNVPAIEAAWRDVHRHMTGLALALATIEEQSASIEVVNAQAERVGLRELVISVARSRAKVAEEVHGGPLYVRPEPGKPFAVRTNSGRGPMDAFDLQERNKEALATDEALRKEPFTVLAKEIIPAIEVSILGKKNQQRHERDRFVKPKPIVLPVTAA